MRKDLPQQFPAKEKDLIGTDVTLNQQAVLECFDRLFYLKALSSQYSNISSKLWKENRPLGNT